MFLTDLAYFLHALEVIARTTDAETPLAVHLEKQLVLAKLFRAGLMQIFQAEAVPEISRNFDNFLSFI